jgi:hypothetical protein
MVKEYPEQEQPDLRTRVFLLDRSNNNHMGISHLLHCYGVRPSAKAQRDHPGLVTYVSETKESCYSTASFQNDHERARLLTWKMIWLKALLFDFVWFYEGAGRLRWESTIMIGRAHCYDGM